MNLSPGHLERFIFPINACAAKLQPRPLLHSPSLIPSPSSLGCKKLVVVLRRRDGDKKGPPSSAVSAVSAVSAPSEKAVACADGREGHTRRVFKGPAEEGGDRSGSIVSQSRVRQVRAPTAINLVTPAKELNHDAQFPNLRFEVEAPKESEKDSRERTSEQARL